MWRSPRAIERFLNTLAVREHLASMACALLRLDILVKLLELRHSEALQGLVGQTTAERQAFIEAWEELGAGRRRSAYWRARRHPPLGGRASGPQG